ncbi:penicillin-insensitive murein endopeptidase (plasmid) [Rhizobium sp. TH2]|uniref:S8 family serine peptidase n=1 Tax=Rhizobium sp. TH2 TaxID=2775403 RepID=UPI0021579805|nr:S8 family serine peptidase [Rhizobium sp. TH2]UVC12309.1 penicillin-insensitive murein endopeptidase [Rhizobium sp. TH2]
MAEVALESNAALNWANKIARASRWVTYKTKTAIGFKGLHIVEEGDSWTQYPLLLDDIVDQLGNDSDKAIFSLGAAGDLVEDMAARKEYLPALTQSSARILILSGGGNDILGDGRFAALLLPFAAGKQAEDLLNLPMLDAELRKVLAAYRSILTDVRLRFPQVRVLGHAYDVPYPQDGARWIGKPLADRGISLAIGRKIVGLVLDRFTSGLRALESEFSNFRFVDLRGKVDKGRASWFDELHPKNEGFGRAAEEFRKAIAIVAAEIATESAAGGSPDGAEIAIAALETMAGGNLPSLEAASRAVVVLDPGHGGTAPPVKLGGSSWNNAIGPSGTLEKTLTLDVAKKTKAVLEGRGFEVLLTRDGDNNLSLANRAAVAKMRAAPVFVSIHFNASDNHNAQGTETFVHNNHIDASRRLCVTVQGSMVSELGLSDRNRSHPGGVKQAAFGVIDRVSHSSRTAAVLLEVSFLDRVDEEAKLKTEAYRIRIAKALARGIESYLGTGVESAGFETADASEIGDAIELSAAAAGQSSWAYLGVAEAGNRFGTSDATDLPIPPHAWVGGRELGLENTGTGGESFDGTFLAVANSEKDTAQAVTRWMVRHFRDELDDAVRGTRFSVPLLCAIACREAGIYWLPLTAGRSSAEILRLCVYDASGDVSGAPRSAFPVNTSEFRATYGQVFTNLLIAETNKARAARGLNASSMIYKGYGIFQYDLQHVQTDEAFFRERKWYDFGECVKRAVDELQRKFVATGSSSIRAAVRAYNGSGPRAEQYATDVMRLLPHCEEAAHGDGLGLAQSTVAALDIARGADEDPGYAPLDPDASADLDTARMLANLGVPGGDPEGAELQAVVASTIAFDSSAAFAFRDACRSSTPRVRYGLGDKVPFFGAVPGRDFTQVDCSGFIREAIRRVTTPRLKFPDGSVVQHDWVKANRFLKGTPADGALNDGVVRIAFLRPQDAASGIGHVLLIVNGKTTESHGGFGPDTRDWASLSWRTKTHVYVLARNGKLADNSASLALSEPSQIKQFEEDTAETACEAPDSSDDAMAAAVAPIDVQLPASETSFYAYGPVQKRFGTALTIQAVRAIADEYFQATGIRLGVGNISRDGGGPVPPHKDHKHGIDVDFRVPRKDARAEGSTWQDASYSSARTRLLVDIVRKNAVMPIRTIFFNDPNISGVTPLGGHDNHLHVSFTGAAAAAATPAESTSAMARPPAQPRVASDVDNAIERTGFAKVLVSLRRDTAGAALALGAEGFAASIGDPSFEACFEFPDMAQADHLAAAAAIDSAEEHQIRPQPVTVFPRLGVAVGIVTWRTINNLRHHAATRAIHEAPVLSLIRPAAAMAVVEPVDVTWGIRRLNVDNAWAAGYDGTGVIVGHLDTGIDATHPALADALHSFAEFDLAGRRVDNAAPRDSGQHGSHTAGTIAGRGLANGARFGVAPGCKLASALVIENGDVITRIIGGMEWVLGQGARVLSMSLGLRGFTPAFQVLINALIDGNVLPVIAVGNEYAGSSRSPGNYAEVLSIGASSVNDLVADFSSSETFLRDRDALVPDVVGPGVDVVSCIPGGGYATMSGSSMATPHIAGLAAILCQANPLATVTQIQDCILNSCTLPPTMDKSRGNRGVPDAIKALKCVGVPAAALVPAVGAARRRGNAKK